MHVRSKTSAGAALADEPGRPEIAGESRYLFAGIAVTSIWLAIAAASIWSPAAGSAGESKS